MWLTVGAHSIVLVCREKQLDEDIRNICADRAICFERWHIEETDEHGQFWGKDIEYFTPEDYFSTSSLPRTALASNAFAKASIQADDARGFMQFELYALLAVIEGRSEGPFSVLANDAMKVEELAYELVNGHADGDADEAGRQNDTEEDQELSRGNDGITRPDILLTLNAGLSRLSSQALSGTTPILRTECHFWPHSFLGTGVANLALRNVTAFLTSITASTRFDQKIYALSEKTFEASSFSVNKPDNKFPDFVCLDRREVASTNNLDGVSDSETAELLAETGAATTPITYYSGRDGFMNGPLTTSAPLPSVSGCNSYQWNLGTITHEISHRILSGHIFDCVSVFLDMIYELQESGNTGVSAIDAFFREEPSSYKNFASKMIGRVLMLYSCLGFDEADMKAALADPYEFFAEAEERYAGNIEELLVHIFDFYHFYGSDSENYCTFVWLSWAVLPSIEEKLDEYVVRTLVALGVKYLGRDDWKELAIADFQSVLSQEPLKSRLHIWEDIQGHLDFSLISAVQCRLDSLKPARSGLLECLAA